METRLWEESSLYEQRFWLQIMGDHARFIFGSLPLKELEEAKQAQFFIGLFDHLLGQARLPLSVTGLKQLNHLSYQYVQQFRVFKLHMLREHLAGHLESGLSPTFFNHMLNELDEYMRVLSALIAGHVPPPVNPIHHHLLWLLDASGHANSITADLDMSEKRMIETSRNFAKHFDDYYLKAVEMAGYLRTNLNQFPALARFNKQVELEMLLFMKFLHEIEELRLTSELLGTIHPLMADHMAREECYYLQKLSQVAEVQRPACDPAKPRTASM